MTYSTPFADGPSWRPEALDYDGSAGAGWRRGVGAAPGRRGHGRRLGIAVAALAFVAFTGLLVWVSLWLRPARGTCLVLLGAGYEDNLALPHNAYGMQGLRALGQLAPARPALPQWGAGRLRLLHQPRTLLAVEDWDRGLLTVPEKTIVLFLALHGGADQRGAYLLAQDALPPSEPQGPDAEAGRLRVDKMLDRLEHVARGRNVVLVLDATQVPACWPLGMIHNSFARALDQLDERIAAIPNLVVLSASDGGQRSWVSEELHQTIFTHYLLEGLHGAADGAAGGRKDGRVDALELYKYAARQVQRWVAMNREARQTPVLYPRGERGRERARAIRLAVAGGPARPETPRVFEPPAQLVREWQICDEISKQVPGPAVYSPQLWRRYQDTLLRYEQLVQAGDDASARRLQARLRALEEDIHKGRKLDLSSMQNTLAMPALTGEPAPDAKTLKSSLADLLAAGPDGFDKAWIKLKARHNPSANAAGERLLRLRCCELLLEQLAAGSGDLEKATRFVRLLEDPAQPRPAEAQLVVLMQRDLPRPAAAKEKAAPAKGAVQPPAPPLLSAELLQLALRVRLQAERAALALLRDDVKRPPATAGERYPYSEEVHAWIRPAIKEADQQRRLGQDLLFTTEAPAWDKARTLLRLAEKQYRHAQEAAAQVRHALAVRDEVLADLPYLAQWVARRRPADVKAGLLDRVEVLFAKAHALALRLEQPEAAGPAKGDTPAWQVRADRLRTAAEEVQKAFREIQEQFRQHIAGLEQVDQPAVWRAIDDALAVPFRDAKLRSTLLARKGRIAGRLLVDADRSRATPPTVSTTEQLAREAAARQGRVALAVLGQRWFDEGGGPQRETFEQVQQRLRTFAVEAQWWQSLTEAGEQIGLRWRRLPVEINGLAEVGRTGDPGKARTALRTADRLSRLLDGAESLALAGPVPEAWRRLLVQDLLLWQAERTRLDFLAGEDPARPPYYLAACQAYLNDARRLGGAQGGVAAMRRTLAGMGKLELRLHVGPGQPAGAVLHLTSEDELPLPYEVTVAGGTPVPPGFPTFAVKAGPSLEVVKTVAEQDLDRPWREDAPLRMTCTVKSPLPRQAEATPPLLPVPVPSGLDVRGLYRGHELKLQTRIDLHPLAENILTRRPLPPKAGLCIRGPRVLEKYAPGAGAVAIVLDCSRSMGPPKGKEFSSKTKFARATAALRQVLAKLPRQTVVSLWVFGQAVGAEKTAATAEDTIQQIQAPAAWDPDNAAQLEGLMSRVEWPALEPWNQSPIIRAMARAAQQDLTNAHGHKTLLVITDGMDNRFDKDRQLNPDGQDVRTFFREHFRDVEVDVIGFQVTSKELAKAREQFQVVEQLPVPGKFYTVSEGRELVAVMGRVLRQRLRYWVDLRDNHPVRGNGDDALYLSDDDANDHWLPGGLDPGTYKVRVLAGRRLTRSITLERGDRLLLELNPDRGLGTGEESGDFERLLYSQTFFPWKPNLEKKDWRLAVVQNQWVGGKGLQMLVTLERKHDPQASVLQQIKPVKVWMEAAPPVGAAGPFCQRWHYLAGYPGPAWSIDVPQWLSRGKAAAGGVPVRPELRVWWSPDQEPAYASVERAHDFSALRDLDGKVLFLKDERVVVESVRVEEHLVETGPADRPAAREKRTCLVVRMGHARGRPVWVRLRGLDVAGAEHRFYESAGKYTALFWPVDPKEAERLLQAVEVFSVTAFKQRAQQRDFVLHVQDLYEPQAGEVRPLPPGSSTMPTGGVEKVVPAPPSGPRLPLPTPLPQPRPVPGGRLERLR